jgi:hypothetical protein
MTSSVIRRTLLDGRGSLSRDSSSGNGRLGLSISMPSFTSSLRGDLLVGEYCHQMKGMADSLRDPGEPITDRTLVLNLLCGLSPCYGHQKALIKRIVPFPAF